MRKLFVLLYCAICASFSLKAQSSLSLSGPVCALGGQEYRYTIIGNIPEGAQLCVSGGTITGSASSCTTDLSAGFVKIIWNEGATCNLALSSSQGNASLSVSLTNPLQPGKISEQTKSQYIDFNTLAAPIICAAASGGSCSPQYQYQWQSSSDKLSWEDVTGATTESLSYSSSLKQPLFFRRKTTEIGSQTIVYSDEAAVYVNADTSGH